MISDGISLGLGDFSETVHFRGEMADSGDGRIRSLVVLPLGLFTGFVDAIFLGPLYPECLVDRPEISYALSYGYKRFIVGFRTSKLLRR